MEFLKKNVQGIILIFENKLVVCLDNRMYFSSCTRQKKAKLKF